MNSKWLKDLNVKAKKKKTSRRKHKGTSSWPQICQSILRYDTKTRSSRRKNREFRLLKTFVLQRTSSRKCKDNPENERKYLQIVYLIRAYTLEYPTLQADSIPAEPQGKPKNTGVGSLSFLQGIFLTQESNRSLLHCRRILYQLSYEGSPGKITGKTNWRSICLNIYILKYLLICLFVPGAHCGTRDL